MAKLKAATRNNLKASTFGLPAQRKYPIDITGRAANAKGRAKQQLDAGRLSEGQYSKIVSKANRKLGK